MFDVGFWEISLILILALIVLGPERLPQAARTVGYWVGKARRYIEGVKSEVEKEFDSGELKRMLHNQEVQIKELQSKLTNSEDYVNQSYHNMFDDRDDPGTAKPENDEDQITSDRYEILEEDDELEQRPDQKSSTDEKTGSQDETESGSASSAEKSQ